jgi:hypothetical protein
MHTTDHRPSHAQHDGHSRGSASSILERVSEAGSSLAGSPGKIWHAAREGTQDLAEKLPDSMGLDHVKHFIRRHPVVSTGAAVTMGYMLLGGSLPLIGGILGVIRRKR